MRNKTLCFVAPILAICLVLTAWNVLAQTGNAAERATRREPPARTAEDPEKTKVYIPVRPVHLEQFADQFQDLYVQIPDYFGERVEQRDFPSDRELRPYDITPESHFAFTTDRASGSNMICFARRDDEETQQFFDMPLVPEARIYLMGKVGRRVDTDWGRMTLFVVDRLVRGHTPPPKKAEKKKPLLFILEWETETPQGIKLNELKFEIPESGKRYEIPDPYDQRKKLYVTFKF